MFQLVITQAGLSSRVLWLLILKCLLSTYLSFEKNDRELFLKQSAGRSVCVMLLFAFLYDIWLWRRSVYIFRFVRRYMCERANLAQKSIVLFPLPAFLLSCRLSQLNSATALGLRATQETCFSAL